VGAAFGQLVTAAQAVTNVGLIVDASGVAPGTALVDGLYLAREIKPVLELMDNMPVDTGVPHEFRVDCYRDSVTGRFVPVVRVGAPRIGRRWEDAPLTFAYPDGGLLKWRLLEDGGGANNVMPLLGSGSGDAQPFDVLYDTDAGMDEIASGFSSWMTDFRSSDTDDLDLVWVRAVEAMRAGVAGEYVFTDVKLAAPSYLGVVAPGDDVGLEVKSRALQEWPNPVLNVTRVLAEEVTVGDGGKADQVSVTIGGTT
jgi:hypothetical protein